jgi:hypothetical protein
MKSSISRSAAWLFTTREEFHGEANYVIRSRLEQR